MCHLKSKLDFYTIYIYLQCQRLVINKRKYPVLTLLIDMSFFYNLYIFLK